ncbi:AAA family ATPase [Leisingera aquaemixtae]|uniref:DNA 3'-5' helicase n=1 Tax=Leisingera aquaemixtae TaxID=1396826 RepID=A0ABY5WEP3_9RHOB|nr:UvrD-helicase domain-containing protein [Leisingera aquaemixtae]UWQ39925.1 AAA family ATPase [Leisingera aquaemixtae]
MTKSPETLNLSIDISCNLALEKVPASVRKQFWKLVQKLHAHPEANGNNLERVKGGSDKRMRSIRIDQGYRAIALQEGADLLLVHVDEHDKAYAWAERRRAVVDDITQSVRFVVAVSEEAEAPAMPPVKAEHRPGLFDAWTDDELISVGVLADHLPTVRAIVDEDTITAAPELDEVAQLSLTGLAAGLTVEEVRDEIGLTEAPANKVTFSEALRSDIAQRRIRVLDDKDLEAFVERDMAAWRIFLHPMQRRLAEGRKSTTLVRGGAGTGKTVVAMHRARWLADQIRRDPSRKGRKVLVTTFTRNLASDIRQNLWNLCPENLSKSAPVIEVMNLDAWVSEFLRARNFGKTIVFGDHKDLKKIWEDAFDQFTLPDGLSQAFVKDEWRQIIQAQGLEQKNEYFRASRTGRGSPLSRPMRKELWAIYEYVRARMVEQGIAEPDDGYRAVRAILDAGSITLPFDHIVVDETQDMGEQAIRLLRAMVPERENDLFLVGDAHQRIYPRKASMTACGVNVRGRRSNILRINYRTTEEIRRWAVSVMTGQAVDDMDTSVESSKGYRSLMHGPEPLVAEVASKSDELVNLVEWLKCIDLKTRTVGICTYTRRQRDEVNDHLIAQGLKTEILERDSDDSSCPGIKLLTMHRSKGLEFDAVCLMFIGAQDFPPAWIFMPEAFPDDASREDELQRLRSLVHVAATRARGTLRISLTGQLSKDLFT